MQASCRPASARLLKGILMLVDFAHVADEISEGEAYANMTRASGPSARRWLLVHDCIML